MTLGFTSFLKDLSSPCWVQNIFLNYERVIMFIDTLQNSLNNLLKLFILFFFILSYSNLATFFLYYFNFESKIFMSLR